MSNCLETISAKYLTAKSSRAEPARNTNRPSPSGPPGATASTSTRSVDPTSVSSWTGCMNTPPATAVSNPGRTSNKCVKTREPSWRGRGNKSFSQSCHRFPRPKPQRDVAGRHYLTKPELNALYFATHQMPRPRGWNQLSVGHYWRAAMVLFYNYAIDTGTVWKSAAFHEPILWRHVTWDRPPNGPGKQSR